MCHVIPLQNQLCVPRKQDLIKCSIGFTYLDLNALPGRREGCFVEDRKPLHLLLVVRSERELESLSELNQFM